jgi:hypothetical protein
MTRYHNTDSAGDYGILYRFCITFIDCFIFFLDSNKSIKITEIKIALLRLQMEILFNADVFLLDFILLF